MRVGVEGLATSHPLVGLLPAYLQEDQFLARMLSAFDEVLAPVSSVLDCLEAYHDPLLAPADFVDWLGAWVGAVLDDDWPDALRRQVVLNATRLNRGRGTVEGLRDLLELVVDGEVEVADHAATEVSASPTSREERVEPLLEITIRVDRPGAVRRSLLEELVESAKPAHLPHRIEVETR